MKRSKKSQCLFISIALLSSFFISTAVIAEQVEVFPGEYVVELAASGLNISAQQMESELSKLGAKVLDDLGEAKLVSPNVGNLSVAGTRAAVAYNPNDTFCSDLEKSGAVKSCSPNYKLSIVGTPNDPRFGELWGLQPNTGIDAVSAWDTTTGSDSIVVAVVDTGVDFNHPDLNANMWVNTQEIPGNGRDDDNNGFVDDIYGINAINNSGNPMDDNAHGTHVAGTIGARGNNSVGVVGVNWRVKIMALKFLDQSGGGSLSDAIKAINYMVTMKRRGVNIKISNNSWGGGGYSSALNNAIKSAENEGIIFVAAAGNSSNDNDMFPSYPAGYELSNVVSVAAIDRNQNLASFSNFGASSVDIAAPGVSILSTVRNGAYSSFSGTSMAAPHVSGALALLLASEPNLSMTAAIDRVYLTGRTLPTLSGLVKTGRTLDVARALRSDTTPLPNDGAEEQNCVYQMTNISYSPDYAADAAPIAVQADELNYHRVDLPFSFPYFGREVSTIFLSPNGVIYTKNAPATYDYTTGSRAPLSSIAALHTDLIATSDPLGIRYVASADKVVIYWRSKHYYARNNGDVEIRTVIFKDGTINNFIGMPDPITAASVRLFATVGLTGASSNKAFTHASNSTLIRDRLAVNFKPVCNGTELAKVTALNFGLDLASRKNLNRSLPGKRHHLSLAGSGSGFVNLDLLLDGVKCPAATQVYLSSGYYSSSFSMPRVVRNFSRIAFRSNGLRKAMRVKTKFTPNQLSKKAESKRFNRACSAVYNALGAGY